ncbi:MAG: ParA family protein [Actinobacteria bacterium]|nr:ParA family protein [Actinomycetota bacterium]
MRRAVRPDTLGHVISISVLSLKGGVGKTSVALGLAGAAAKRGLAALVIDLDPQGNATSILQARHGRSHAAAVLAHPTIEVLQGAITKTAWTFKEGRVDVVGSDPELIRYDAWTGKRGFAPKLARAMRRLEGYDVVIIDCPPSLGALTREALAASDLAVVVTTPSYFGAQGAERAIDEIKEIRATVNPGLRFAGIIVNRLREKTEEHRYRKRELIAIHGPGAILKPAVPERVALQQAESTGEPISAVKSAGARDVAKVFDKQMARLIRMARDADASE